MSLGGAVYNILSNDTNTAAIVGTKIFPNIATQKTNFPFIIYTVIDSNPEDTKDLTGDVNRIRLQVSCFCKTYTQCETLEAAVIAILNRWNGTSDSTVINSFTLDNQVDLFEEDNEVYHKAIDFIVRLFR